MIQKRHIESSHKEFGELFTIHMPDLQSPDDDDDCSDLRFDLRPEFPSHIPTPETISVGIDYHIQTIFLGDDAKPKKRIKRERNLKKPTNSTGDVVTSTNSLQTSNMKILIASSYSTKWGSDVWNSMKLNAPVDSSPSGRTSPISGSNSTTSDESNNDDDTDNSSLASNETPHLDQPNARRAALRRMIAKGPASPTKSVGKSLIAEKKKKTISPTDPATTLTPSKAKEKWILSGNTLEPIVPVTNQKTSKTTSNMTSHSSPSSLQRKWMMENALNLHAACQRDDNEDFAFPRRSRFLARLHRSSGTD